MDIGNNLNIESLQDTYYAKSKNNSWSASASFSAKGRGDGPKYSGGIGGGGTSINSTTDSQWVNEQTSIIADNNINIRTKNNTNLIGSVVASNSDNLTLNTQSLTYQDLNDYYTSTTKGSGLTTNVGTSSDSFFKGIAPNGTTTITLVNSGEDKKQDTRATIGNGNIVIADNKDISDLNRDMTKSQETTQDQITGALNGEMKIDNRIFGAIKYGDKKTYETDENGNPVLDENGNQKVNTQKEFGVGNGWKSIYSDAKNFAGNTKDAIIGASKDADLIAQQIYELPGFGEDGLGTQIVGTILGPLTVFGQERSYLRNKDGVVNQEDIVTAGKDYMVLGQASGEGGAIDELRNPVNESLVVRVNPTDGLIGDTLKSGVMKVFNTIGLDDMIAMNRYVANDLEMRKDNEYSVNNFHSQGTIIGTGAFDILKDKGVKLDKTQTMNPMGPAVYETNWYNEARQVINERQKVISKDSPLGKPGSVIKSNIQYNHNPNDGVRDAAAPRSPYHFGKGIINLLINMDQHYMDSYRNK